MSADTGVPVYRRPRLGGVSFQYGDFIPEGVRLKDVEWGRWYPDPPVDADEQLSLTPLAPSEAQGGRA